METHESKTCLFFTYHLAPTTILKLLLSFVNLKNTHNNICNACDPLWLLPTISSYCLPFVVHVDLLWLLPTISSYCLPFVVHVDLLWLLPTVYITFQSP
jgi:hypothetical protein